MASRYQCGCDLCVLYQERVRARVERRTLVTIAVVLHIAWGGAVYTQGSNAAALYSVLIAAAYARAHFVGRILRDAEVEREAALLALGDMDAVPHLRKQIWALEYGPNIWRYLTRSLLGIGYRSMNLQRARLETLLERLHSAHERERSTCCTT